MNNIIITGFDPFDKLKINPSMEVVKNIGELENINLYKLILPTVYKDCSTILIDKIAEVKPCVVISFGLAGGRKKIFLERFAINMDDGKTRDNSGEKRSGQFIREKAPLAYLSNLPLDTITKVLHNNKIKAGISNFCGTFVCNHLMYTVMDYMHNNNLNLKFGFIHLPKISKQMTLEKMLKAAEIIINESVENYRKSY